jgi:hypothetical protein
VTRIGLAVFRRLALSASSDIAYPLAQLPALGAIVIPIALARLVALRVAAWHARSA